MGGARSGQVNNILISMQIDVQGLLTAALNNLDDRVKSGPDGIPPYFGKRLRFSLLNPLRACWTQVLHAFRFKFKLNLTLNFAPINTKF